MLEYVGIISRIEPAREQVGSWRKSTKRARPALQHANPESIDIEYRKQNR